MEIIAPATREIPNDCVFVLVPSQKMHIHPITMKIANIMANVLREPKIRRLAVAKLYLSSVEPIEYSILKTGPSCRH